jgi:uncharacterized membrane protein
MESKDVLAALAFVFITAAAVRAVRDRSIRHPQTRTWLTIAAIFAVVSAWLFYST